MRNRSEIFDPNFTTTRGAEEKKYSAAYKFHKPTLNMVQKWLSQKKADEIAGYVGTFTLDDQKEVLIYSSKY